MNEMLLDKAIVQYYDTYLDSFSDSPEHKFSFKHRMKMKRIFRLYEKNTNCYRDNINNINSEKPRLKLTRKTIVMIIALIFVAIVAGCATAYFISKSFRGDVHQEYTQMFAIDTENCPDTIEYTYYFSEIPNGFELSEYASTDYFSYTSLINDNTRQTILLRQFVKSHYYPKYNTENNSLYEIEINGSTGIILDLSNDLETQTLLVWDNGDYILEILANLDRIEIEKLIKMLKIVEY